MNPTIEELRKRLNPNPTLKELREHAAACYPQGFEAELVKASPAWGLLPRRKDFFGEGQFLDWDFIAAFRASASYRVAAMKSPVPDGKMLITRAKEYATFIIDREDFCDPTPDRLKKLYSQRFHGALKVLARSIELKMFGDGSGALGKVESVKGDVLQLAANANMGAFDVGMSLQTAPAGGIPFQGIAVLREVNRTQKTLKAHRPWQELIPEIIPGYFLYRDGDHGVAGKGFAFWVPEELAPDDDCFGQNRNQDRANMAGHSFRYSENWGPGRSALREAVKNAHIAASLPSHGVIALMSPERWKHEGEGKRVVQVQSRMPGITYEGFEIRIGGDEENPHIVIAVASPGCPPDKIWLIDPTAWSARTLGEFPAMFADEFSLQDKDCDCFIETLGGYYQPVCERPRDNAVITLDWG